MARLIFGMVQSLDGYIAGAPGGPELPPPGPALHRHFNDHVSGLAGKLPSAETRISDVKVVPVNPGGTLGMDCCGERAPVARSKCQT